MLKHNLHTSELMRGLGFLPAITALTMFAWLVGWCSPAEAASGTVHSNSNPGWNVTVDTRWVDGAGYRPVRVTVTPRVPTIADKTLTVEFLLFRWPWSRDSDLRVARDIEVPAGSGPVEVTLSVPQQSGWSSYAINVLEDGKLQRRLSMGWASGASPATDWQECFPAVLVVGDMLPDTSQLATRLPIGYYSKNQPGYSNQPGRRTGQGVSQTSPQLPSAVSREVADLPRRWIDYSSLDVVCLSLEQLRQLAEKHPVRLRAVLEWTAAGGNLWVYAVGQEWERLGELEKSLDLPPEGNHGWTEPDKVLFGKSVQGALTDSAWLDGRYVGRQWAKAPPTAHFLTRPYDMGLIVVFAAANPFPGTNDEWNWVLGEIGPERWLWYQRHGVSMFRENRDYWNFLIPGVGLAPVTEFCVLITLFVLAIGPVNYWLLRRWRRLHLLVVTIPGGAATVTFVLFAYAIVADGLATRVRVRSVTQLDQGRGQAACWARLSYYAGLAPGGGLTFPDDVAVLPLEHIPAPDYGEGPRRRELIWGDDQWLASGWLSSRTPMQLLTVRSRPSDLGLELIRTGSNPKELQVKNRLGRRIRQLVVRADDRNYYWAEGIDPDKTVELEPFRFEARAKLRQTCRENQPAMPPGFQGQYYGGIFRSGYYRRRFRNPAIKTPTQQTSRLEVLLANLDALAGGDVSALEPGSYVAIVRQSPEVVLGTASAREEASHHVIFGKW